MDYQHHQHRQHHYSRLREVDCSPRGTQDGRPLARDAASSALCPLPSPSALCLHLPPLAPVKGCR